MPNKNHHTQTHKQNKQTKQTKKSNQLCNVVENEIKLVSKKTSKLTIFTNYNKYIMTQLEQLYQSHLPLIQKIINIHYQLKMKHRYTFTKKVINVNKEKKYKLPHIPALLNYLLSSSTEPFKTTSTINKTPNYRIIEEHIQHILKIIQHNQRDIYQYLHDNIELGNEIIIFINNNYKNLLEHFPELEFHSLLYNSFTSFKILETLENDTISLQTISLRYNGKTYKNLIFLFDYNQNNRKYKKSFNDVNDIIHRILFFNEFLETDKLPNKFIFFLTDMKKVIDSNLENTAHFRTLNINSAVTNGHDIIIYRKEELLKSIFHELIHFHDMDYKFITGKHKQQLFAYILNNHHISNDNEYLFYECITESLTNFLNVIYSIHPIYPLHQTKLNDNKTTNIPTNNNIKKQFITHFKNELIFSTLQISKILKLCGFKSWIDFINKTKMNNSTTKIQKIFKQDSCIFSYYILKLYILLNMNDYLNNILDAKLYFKPTDATIENLINIFENSKNNKYLDDMLTFLLNHFFNKNQLTEELTGTSQKKITKQLSKKISQVSNAVNIYKTLRMTCLHN